MKPGEPAPASHAMGGHWLATWTAAPQLTEPDDLPPAPFTRDGTIFADSTLRQTVRVSAGGQRIRLRFSNAHGATDLAITRTLVALPSGGHAGVSSITAGTSRTVTFSGRPGTVIRPGGQVISDPVDFPLTACATVSVTIYLAAGQPAAGGITSHSGSRTTTYALAGEHAEAGNLTGAAAIDHWYFLSGIDTWSQSAVAAAVMLGDSLTDGRGSTTNGNNRWPDQLFARLRVRRDLAVAAILNQGIGGNRVLRDGKGTSVLGRLDRDVLGVCGARWLVVFAGVNDIGKADATVAVQRQVVASLIAAYEQIVSRAHAHGIRVYGATLTPFGGSDPYDDQRGRREAARQAVNGWIRDSRRFDAVLDFDAAVRDPPRPRRIMPPLDTGDHLHLNPAGYRALADAVPASCFRSIPCQDQTGQDQTGRGSA